MKIRRRPVIPAALLALVAFPASSYAAEAICNSPPSASACAVYDFQTCPQQCATSSCAAPHVAGECAPYLQPQYVASYAATKQQLTAAGQPASKLTILPSVMAQRDGVAPGTVFDALPIAMSSRTALGSGNGNGYQDSSWGLGFVSAVEYPRYGQYDEGWYNTLSIDSCQEYVWKKWGQISWFDDIAHSAGTNYGWVVDVIGEGTLGVVWDALTQGERWDGQSVALNGTPVVFPTTIQRNPFFVLNPNWLSTSTDPTIKAIYQQLNAVGAQGQAITFPSTTVLNETWAAGEKKYLEEAGVTASAFADDERRMTAFQALTAQYVNDLNAEEAYIEGCYHAILYCKQSAKYKAYQAAIAADQQALANALVAEWNYDANQGCLGYTMPVSGEKSIPSDYVSGQSSAGFTFRANACDWSPHKFYQQFVDMFEPQVEAAMTRCIADTGDDFAPVASAPASLFADQRLQGVAYDHALTQRNNDVTTYVPNQATQSLSDYRNSTSMEQFFWNYENRDAISAAFQPQIQAAAKTFASQTTSLPLQGPAPGTSGPNYIGAKTGDSNSIGGSYFGGGYSYSAWWSVTPRVETQAQASHYPTDQTPHICSLSADAGASLKVTGTVFGSGFTLLDAALEVSADPPATSAAATVAPDDTVGSVALKQAHFTIMGNDYLAQPLSNAGLKEGQSWSGKSFDFPLTETPVDVSYSTIIPILFIPLEVSAGLTVKIGTELTASATPPVTCDRDNIGFALRTAVTPSAEVDAYAQVAVDLGIASAGIQGNLTIFKGAMPVSGSVTLASSVAGDANQIDLVLGTSGNLQMTELSGDVDLFAEVLGDRADVSLFSWDGFHQNIPLFNLTQSYPLLAVNYRLNGTVDTVK